MNWKCFFGHKWIYSESDFGDIKITDSNAYSGEITAVRYRVMPMKRECKNCNIIEKYILNSGWIRIK